MADSKPLAGVGVLVTRPARQAGHLSDLIAAAGGRAVRFPVLEITGPAEPRVLIRELASLDAGGMIVFVSANAARHALGALREQGLSLPDAEYVATGPGTERAMRESGLKQLTTAPPPFDSETLLTTRGMQAVAGRRILIVRGDGGRALLGDTLKARGAKVQYVEAYRRRIPNVDSDPLLASWAAEEVQVVTVTSSQSLTNLHAMVGPRGRGLLRTTPLVVISGRTATLAERFGIESQVMIAREASDEAIMETLITWRGNAHHREGTGAGRG
jgi:uroporphyrinogen-III synthase